MKLDLTEATILDHLETIKATRYRSVRLPEGGCIKLINTFGKQVVDTWAFCIDNPREFMSMEHSRAYFLRISPLVGDVLVTNQRRPILQLIEDTTPGCHDTLIASCDRNRYSQLHGAADHPNCSDNLVSAMRDEAMDFDGHIPCPLNLFMNVPVEPDGKIAFVPPTSDVGQYVVLKALMPLVLVMSACPQDITPVNAMAPQDMHYHVY